MTSTMSNVRKLGRTQTTRALVLASTMGLLALSQGCNKPDGKVHAKAFGINVVGLERKGAPAATIQALKQAYRLLFRAHLAQHEALEKVGSELGEFEEVRILAEFIARSERGVIR